MSKLLGDIAASAAPQPAITASAPMNASIEASIAASTVAPINESMLASTLAVTPAVSLESPPAATPASTPARVPARERGSVRAKDEEALLDRLSRRVKRDVSVNTRLRRDLDDRLSDATRFYGHGSLAAIMELALEDQLTKIGF